MIAQDSLEAGSLPALPPRLATCPADDAVQDDSFPTQFPVFQLADSMDFVSRAFHEAHMEAEKALVKNTNLSKKKKDASNEKVKQVKKDSQKVKKEATKDKEIWWSCLKVASCPLQKFYEEDRKGNKTMSKKNFASRIYHRVDKFGSREQARAAHRAALEFYH